MKRVITKLKWVGDHDALAAGFKVTLECGHTFFRPTNVVACDAIGKKLVGSEVFCKQCHPQ